MPAGRRGGRGRPWHGWALCLLRWRRVSLEHRNRRQGTSYRSSMVEVMAGWAAPDRVEEVEGARIPEGGAGSGQWRSRGGVRTSSSRTGHPWPWH
uniref:Uncharacterized protein n=1 Tax=Aegilops tauschii subsp. strangulata TaxID=200361 RepID=A0A453MCF3_AEGTS